MIKRDEEHLPAHTGFLIQRWLEGTPILLSESPSKWTSLVISPDGQTATLEMENVAVVDQPKWPALDAVGTPVIMSFRMIWKATDEKIVYDDPQKQFRVEGYRATAQVEAQVEVPSIGFSWQTDPLSMSQADFAIIGDEANGR